MSVRPSICVKRVLPGGGVGPGFDKKWSVNITDHFWSFKKKKISKTGLGEGGLDPLLKKMVSEHQLFFLNNQ